MILSYDVSGIVSYITIGWVSDRFLEVLQEAIPTGKMVITILSFLGEYEA